ncbi:GTP-binding protein [Caballeronia sp. ATUFL_M1_KS5A]|uniref:CobW family GTP-binding protein n=1 Tax=Caballeronia sp. ATUFL_M1_KS5A TaxID=2921778 RepID=UPI002028FBBA|nr:GTP-binding protein [Caballeronia sp. ATUFL_M1_KS5A]
MTTTIPTLILAGNLGSGKTTLLKHLLEQPDGERITAFVNDFADINIDAELIESHDGSTVTLTNGCVCCSVQEDLAAAMVRAAERGMRPDRAVIECSGASRPANLLALFHTRPLDRRYHVDGLFYVIDAFHFSKLDYASTEAAIDAAAISDLVLLNKCDLVEERALASIDATLHDAQPTMKVVRTSFCRLPTEVVHGTGRRMDLDDARLADEHDTAQLDSLSYEWSEPPALARWMEVSAALPAGLLRAKGIFGIANRTDAKAVFQLVGKRSTVELLEGTPARRHAVIFIFLTGTVSYFELDAVMARCGAHRRVLRRNAFPEHYFVSDKDLS